MYAAQVIAPVNYLYQFQVFPVTCWQIYFNDSFNF